MTYYQAELTGGSETLPTVLSLLEHAVQVSFDCTDVKMLYGAADRHGVLEWGGAIQSSDLREVVLTSFSTWTDGDELVLASSIAVRLSDDIRRIDVAHHRLTIPAEWDQNATVPLIKSLRGVLGKALVLGRALAGMSGPRHELLRVPNAISLHQVPTRAPAAAREISEALESLGPTESASHSANPEFGGFTPGEFNGLVAALEVILAGDTSRVSTEHSAAAHDSAPTTTGWNDTAREEQQVQITVYTKPASVQSNALLRALDRARLNYTVVDISQNPAARDYVMALGYLHAPVVVAGEDHWSGFRPDRINAIAEWLHARR